MHWDSTSKYTIVYATYPACPVPFLTISVPLFHLM